MTFRIDTWLKAMQRKTSRGVRNARRGNRMPRLEILEDRTLPSTLTVTNTSDTGVAGDGSLRGEIAAAQNGDTITFDPSLAGKTITLTSGELLITQNIGIVGPTPNNSPYLTINGNNNGRVFNIENTGTANVSLSNLKITGGASGSNTPNVATEGGGLLIDIGTGTVTLDNVFVSGNRDSGNYSTSPVAAQGGGLAFVGGNSAKLVLKNGFVETNLAQGFGDAQGGGIYAVGGGVSLTNEFIDMNTAQGYKGLQGAKPTTKNGGYNTGGVGGTGGLAQGGGLYVAGSTITMDPNSGIQNNNAKGGTGGPGGFNGGFGGQGGDAQGGGIYMTGGVFSLTGSNTNSATGLGGNHTFGGFGGFGGQSNRIAPGTLNAGSGGAGGDALGGTLYLASGTVNLINSSGVQGYALAGTGAYGASGGPHLSNSAIGGGNGGNGGNAFGGGIYVAKGALTFTNESNLGSAQGNLSGVVMGGKGGFGGHGVGKGARGGNAGNSGDASGGGLYVAGGVVTLIDNTLAGSQVTAGNGSSGGSPSPPSFDTNGKAHYGAAGSSSAGGGAYGGGGYVAGGTVSLIGDTVSGNQVRGGDGGAVGDFAGPTDGQAGGNGFGGGFYVAGGTVTLINDTFGTGNTVVGGHGGAGGPGATVKSGGHDGGNGSSGGGAYGGGVFVANGSVSLTSDTLSNNSLQGGDGGYGGKGVSGFDGGNAGGGGNVKGGGLFQLGGTLTFANTLIAQNSAVPGSGGLGGSASPPGFPGSQGANGTITGPDVSGAPISSDHDLIGNNSGFNPVTSTGDVVNVNPDLGPLQNNGGPTDTMALLTGSPAIDSGDNNVPGLPADDQRGYSRIVGAAADIGAYEFGAGPATADLSITGNATATVSPGGEQVTYNLIVANSSATAQSNVTVASVLPANTTLVSWTVPGGWSGSGPAAGSGSGTLSAWIASLAANSSATITLVVHANNGTPADTATVGPVTGDPTPGDNIVTLTPTLSSNLNISPVSLPSAQVGVSYRQSLSATGGTSPYQFRLVNGQGTGLPAGLTLNSDGTITGTATVSGTFTFEAQVTDSSPAPGPFNQTSSLLTLTVSAPTGSGGGNTGGGTGGGNTGGGGTGGGNAFGTGAGGMGAGADFVDLAIDEFELTIDMLLVLIEGMSGQPHADLDATIAQLQSAIANDPLLPTFEGQLAVLLGESVALNVLSGA